MLYTLAAFAVALGILITFHELGHYWVARLCGVRVLRFSVGFGKVLARRTDRHGTEWAVSAIPLGGYVKMQDQAPPGAPPEEVAATFDAQPVGKRFAIVAAGPIFNLVLAAALYAGIYAVGSEEPAPVLSQPTPDSIAAQAGVQAGDRVLAVNGHQTSSWNQVRWELLDAMSKGDPLRLDVAPLHGGRAQRDLFLPRLADPSEGDPIGMAGLRLSAVPVVRELVAGSAAEAAGLRPGDRIVSVAQQDGPDLGALIDTIQAHAGQPLALGVLRDGTRLSLSITPQAEAEKGGRTIGRIGAQLGADVERVTVRYGLADSAWRGVVRTVDTAWFSLRMMGRMVTGDVSVRNVSGPVTIADYAGQTARIGLASYIAFLALVSVSLGVLNLLPIPMLDGGHLLYYLVEMFTGRRPSERWLMLGQRVGIVALAGLMSLALFNDLSRLFT